MSISDWEDQAKYNDDIAESLLSAAENLRRAGDVLGEYKFKELAKGRKAKAKLCRAWAAEDAQVALRGTGGLL